ncbi:RNA-binding transcriptional accessory protein [Weissella paramesenteroides]|uniref:Tex-like protein N-terminal domain protein n=3 Tax=Weissella paramesenteroides TaxID=1249 RepID=C5R7Z4_WEIPA|nr:Tex family protein [Weissella paramesenteroides]ATF41670.1 RNA-binding transcriptional accessory protein [Weissella paramesenteroides]EER75691.1 Tex-like protein N-terminal domain protein [Weissella paramesenteroides ATCC 33313]KAA8438116.1 RNA-binding transcriptional accessory protein [Weissella paramesenteroides]KAA8441288.1 RNA-binding transcriptional accessory protein [Weissella paramesenteroides]KAA8441504.1 RNA-binding transcriptional accessory protein [Weissella paramesenteroides]
MTKVAEMNATLEIDIAQSVGEKLSLPTHKVKAVTNLLDEGNTVPFIARYRKEATGNLDEVQIRDIQSISKQLAELQARKQTVYKAIAEQNMMSSSIQQAMVAADTLQKVEDIYLPFKKKRQTKATLAKEAGLMPFARLIQKFPSVDLQVEATKYINPEKDIKNIADVFSGVHEIFAEVIGENAGLRDWVRQFTLNNGHFVAKLKRGANKKDEQGVFELYYDFDSLVKKIQNHQILAINRGEKEGILSGNIIADEDAINRYLKFRLVGSKLGSAVDILVQAAQDAYKRFIGPAIAREIRKKLFNQASEDAIKVFGTNLYHLLMAAPLHGQIVLGFDPGIRTGSKLAVVDQAGQFLDKAVIYPHKAPKYDPEGAREVIISLVKKYHVSIVAIGNGTASRESQQFIAKIIKDDLPDLRYVVVNEAGASVYSASDVAREEFPDLPVEQRSAISIARRLQDPMAELIKIDPQAVGVGQYQHDLPEKELSLELDNVLETSVNQVGVNLNTASPQLLTHIAGLTATIAQNIVAYRNENGQFQARSELKKVSKLGPKAFEQAAGFLRIPKGENPLDNTDIHPESYQVAEKVLRSAAVEKLGADARHALHEFDTPVFAQQLGIGYPTLHDIISSLIEPGRDLRDDAPMATLRSDVLTLDDLKVGMQLQGTVRNVVDFGAFVDIGVHEDGLVHISKLSKQHIKNPHAIVAVGDIVTVWVTEIDKKRQRIGLSMIALN